MEAMFASRGRAGLLGAAALLLLAAAALLAWRRRGRLQMANLQAAAAGAADGAQASPAAGATAAAELHEQSTQPEVKLVPAESRAPAMHV